MRLDVPVTHVDAAGVTIGEERIEAETVLWCTGVQGVPLAKTLGVNVTVNGKIAVEKDFSVPGHPECFVIGDAAHVSALTVCQFRASHRSRSIKADT